MTYYQSKPAFRERFEQISEHSAEQRGLLFHQLWIDGTKRFQVFALGLARDGEPTLLDA